MIMNDLLREPIRVLLAGHTSIVNYGLETLINNQKPEMIVVGSYTSCAEVLSSFRDISPDVILVGISTSSQSELDVLLSLIASTRAKVLILKSLQDAKLFDKAMLAGAKGIIEQDVSLETVLKAVEKVYEGELWLNQASIKRLINGLSQQHPEKKKIHDQKGISKLTPKEKKIFFSMIDNVGTPAKVIASKLSISESTLRNHLTSIYEKLHVNNKSELWSFVHKHNLNHEQ